MKSLIHFGAVVAVLAAAVPAFAAPVELATTVMVENHKAAADGTTKVTLTPAGHVVPGNRVVYQIRYRNSGNQPAANLVIANPVPAGLIYAGAGQGSPEPELSVDGTRFGTLSQLSVRTSAGVRAATPADVRVVRWRLSKPVAPGASGQVSFRATLK